MHQQHTAVKPPVRPFVKGYYSHIASIPKIGTAGFALLTVLSNHRVKTNLAWPSQERLSGLTGMCAKTVGKHAAGLADAGLIEIGKARSTQTGLPHNTYSIPESSGPWVKLHTDIIGLIPTLGDMAFGIYSLLARYADCHTFIAYPSDTKIANELGISERTLNRHIDRVYEHRLVQRITMDWSGKDREVYKVIGLRQANDNSSERSDDKSSVYLYSESRPLVKTLSESKSLSESVLPTPHAGTSAREVQEIDLDSDQRTAIPTASMAAQPQGTDLENITSDLADLETERSAALATSSQAASTQGTDADDYKPRTLTYRNNLPVAAMSATASILEVAEDDDVDELGFLPAIEPLDRCDDDTSYPSSVVPGTTNPVMFVANLPIGDTRTPNQPHSRNQDKAVSHEGGENKAQDSLTADQTMDELERVWADLSQSMQAQVRTAIVNRVAERDGERVAEWLMHHTILAEISYLGWQKVWRMVGAMPADAEPVVVSAIADTPVDSRGRVREIVATRAIADTLHDERIAATVSRIEGVDQAGLAELEAAEYIVEQNVVYHLPNGDAFVVSVDAHGYRGAVAMKLDEALELPSLVCVKIEQRHDIARRNGDETVVYPIKPTMIVAEEIAFLDEVGADLAWELPKDYVAFIS